MSGSAKSRNHRREAYRRAVNLVYEFLARTSEARARGCVFSLDNRLTWRSAIRTLLVGCVRLARHPLTIRKQQKALPKHCVTLREYSALARPSPAPFR